MIVHIVDDDAVSRKILKTVVGNVGHEVVESPGGLAALLAYDMKPCRAIISDWAMPDMDGLSLCAEIRKRAKTHYTYFILLTGVNTSNKDYLQAMDSGVDDFLTKPVDPNMIRMRLQVAERIASLDAQVKQLEGIIPVCTYCKNIRREDKVYEKMEFYFKKYGSAQFSHGICPDCKKKHWGKEKVFS